MKKYSPYVFTPVPEIFQKNLVSDYFIAWPGQVTGFLRSRVAHPFFAVEGDEIVGYLEYFDTELEGPVLLEPLVILSRDPAEIESLAEATAEKEPGVERLLENYANLVAEENGSRVPAVNPVGWSSWYHYFTNLHWEDVEKNLEIAGRAGFPFEVFQIDDGYQVAIGDWLEPKPGFRPLPMLAERIAEWGFTPGLWAAPFSASETSRLFCEHPDWFVQEEGKPKECFKNWGQKVYALDTTRSEVKNWLLKTFSGLVRMGFQYFKVDFLFAAAMPGERFKKVTPVQAYREGMETIRAALGNAFILGCGAPLLPSVGFVQGMRIGEDTATYWDAERSPFQGPNAYYALKNSIMRSFLHRLLWLNDPDCLLLRDQEIQLTRNERELYALAAGALDNMIIESDNLELVDEWGQSLLRRAISLRGGKVTMKGLMEDDFYRVESRGGPAGDFQLLANLSNQSKCYKQTEVPPRSARLL
jgi:alpha-galactosidase